MRANVLNDPALMKQARQFAWLSIDSDNPVNAPFIAKFPSEGVPFFLVIDPATDKPVLSWYGTATAPQLGKLLEDGLRAANGGGSGADSLLAQADRLNGQKDYAKAAALYEQALQAGGPHWPRRSRAIESLVMADLFGKNHAACAAVAAREASAMTRDRSFVNIVDMGLQCAEARSQEMAELRQLAAEGVKLRGVGSDDISGLYDDWAASYRKDKDEAADTRITEEWAAYLKQAIATAPTPEARMSSVLTLTIAAVRMHKPEVALPEVERAERDLPDDYNPPYRAARLYIAMGRYDDALAACDRAIAKASGLAKLRLYVMRGNVLQSKGDLEGARQTYNDGLQYGRTLPESAAAPTIKMLSEALDKAK